MILTKTVIYTINKGNIGIFKKIKSDIIIGEILEIPIEKLSINSKVIVKVKCDKCDLEYEINYCNYLKNINNGGYCTCFKCSKIKSKQTFLEKYGVENPFQSENIKNKIKQTNLEKYGVEYPNQNEDIKNKTKQTNLEKYGYSCPLQSENVIEKTKETLIKKYNVDNYSKSEDYSEKVKQTSIKKYGVTAYSKTEESKIKSIETNNDKYGNHPSKRLEHIEKFKDSVKNYQLDRKNIFLEKHKINGLLSIDNKICLCYCNKCKNEFNIEISLFKNRNQVKTTICTICNPPDSGSGLQTQLYEYIKEIYSNKIIQNNRTILNNKYELDIFLPDLKLAFEFNGLYWHNELNKPNDYHKIKSDLCEEQNIRLIHIWEDDWLYKNEIVKSIINNKIGITKNKIYARKCIIKEITNNESKIFLENNHLQGAINSSINIGLYYNNELISLMNFGKKRKIMNLSSTEGEFELLRFCNKINTYVIGGASKLFKYFIKKYNPVEILSYADRSYSNGNLYVNLGFNYINKTEPNYYYIVDGIRKYRFLFRKDILIKNGYDSNLSEHDIMLERNIYRIYNAGNLKYIYNKKS